MFTHMPTEVRVWVTEARGLPVMDRATGLADAYVKIVFGKGERSTPVARKTLSPRWDFAGSLPCPSDDLLLKGAVSACRIL